MTITPEMCAKAKPEVYQLLKTGDLSIESYPALKFPGRKDLVVITDDAGKLEPAKSHDDALRKAQAVVKRWQKQLREKKAAADG